MSTAPVCGCGCGQHPTRIRFSDQTRGLVAGTYYPFVKGHASRLRTSCNYRMVQDPAGPQGRVKLLHLIRAEQALGHPLPVGAEVHHVDEDPWNLQARLVICPDHAYHKLLHRRMRIQKAGGNPNTDKICSDCQQVLPTTAFHRNKTRPDGFNWACKPCQRARRVNGARR